MDVALLNLRSQEGELLARAQEIYRWKNLRDGEPGDVVTQSLETYLKLYQGRYGSEEDTLSQGVVYGPRGERPSHADLDEVARRLVNGGGSSNRGHARKRIGDVNTSSVLPKNGLADLPSKEADRLGKAMIIYQRMNRRACKPREVVLESLGLYIKLYELLSTPRDELSRDAVFGPNSGEVPAADLDEVARRLVVMGRCYRRGDCCRRTIGVHLTEGDILRIEETGRKREEFMDEDGRLKAGPGGCSFFVAGPDGSPNCQVYANRPEACRNFFCNRGPVSRTSLPFSMSNGHSGTHPNGNRARAPDA